jgi:hypothetical protein
VAEDLDVDEDRRRQERNDGDGLAEPPGEGDDHGETHLEEAESDDPTAAGRAVPTDGSIEPRRRPTVDSCRGPPPERPPEPVTDPAAERTR